MVQVVIEDGQIMVTGGDQDMIELIEQHSPVESAFTSVLRDLRCMPEGTRFELYGRIIGRKGNYSIRWDDWEVAS